MTPNLAWKQVAFTQSCRRTSSAPGVAEIAARAALTRPRSSRSLRSAARSSASRESSGSPVVISRRLNCRVGVAS